MTKQVSVSEQLYLKTAINNTIGRKKFRNKLTLNEQYFLFHTSTSKKLRQPLNKVIQALKKYKKFM